MSILKKTSTLFINSTRWPIIFLVVCWGVHLVNTLLAHHLSQYGILPRSLSGLGGIFLSPWLHGSFIHLIMNSVPLLCLGILVNLKGSRVFSSATLFIIVVGGGLVWLLGRSALHIGASGLIFGYFGFLVSDAIKQRTPKSIAIALITLFLYGGMFLALWPKDATISWEGHLFGFLSGLAFPWIWQKKRATRGPKV